MCAARRDISVEQVDGVVTVVARGELDLATSNALRTALESAIGLAGARVVVRLGDVTFMDSTALSALVHGWRLATDKGIVLTVTDPTPAVQRVFKITGLDDLIQG